MELLRNVLKHKEDWKDVLLNESFLSVLSYLKTENLKKVELHMSVPYFVEKKPLERVADPIFVNFNNKVNEEGQLLIEAFFTLLKKYSPDTRPMKYSYGPKKIYADTWVRSVAELLGEMNDRIQTGKDEGVHVVYLIDSSHCEKIPYKDHIPFVNYILY